MKLVRKNILAQGCRTVEMEADKVHSCREEPPGSAMLGYSVAQQMRHENEQLCQQLCYSKTCKHVFRPAPEQKTVFYHLQIRMNLSL